VLPRVGDWANRMVTCAFHPPTAKKVGHNGVLCVPKPDVCQAGFR